MDIAVATARQPDQASIFNYASQAYNNHFFFQGLVSFPPVLPLSLQQPRADNLQKKQSVEVAKR